MFMMKNLLKNEQFQLDEILFEGKNKAYGAYALRQESDRVLTKAFFVGVLFFGVVVTTPVMMNLFKTNTDGGFVIPEDIPPYEITDVDIFKDPVVVPPQEVVPPQDVAIVNTVVPTPTDNPVKQDPPATMDEAKDAVRGFEDRVGTPPVSQIQPPITAPGTGDKVDKPIVTPAPSDNVLHTVVDVEASFNGGINAFREKVAYGFDTGDFDGTGDKISASITFIVEKDGSISQVKASGNDAQFNKEAERTIKKVKGKWTPAKVNGQPVRSYFKFPISMTFN